MTGKNQLNSSSGASFSEVLVALALMLSGLMGAIGAFHTVERSIGKGILATRALAMAESRIEAKRSVRWDRLLLDDLDHDGAPEVLMHDDGTNGDLTAGDGVYSAVQEQDGVLLTWSVTPNRIGSLSGSGFVIIEARASYMWNNGRHEIRLATLRANPSFVGSS